MATHITFKTDCDSIITWPKAMTCIVSNPEGDYYAYLITDTTDGPLLGIKINGVTYFEMLAELKS